MEQLQQTTVIFIRICTIYDISNTKFEKTDYIIIGLRSVDIW